jgi:organic hydroperoxide reductase OsmC/OhrA
VADGILEKNQDRKLAMTKVTLQPIVTFDKNNAPDQKTFDELHHTAHEKCYIANSVKTKISIDATLKTS